MLTCRLKKEMQKEAGGFDEDDFVTPLETPAEGREAEDSFDEDELAAELQELELAEAEENELAEAEAESLQPASKPPTPSSPPSAPLPPSPPPKAKSKTDTPDRASATASPAPGGNASDGADANGTNGIQTPELSKRDKRRAREAKKKAEEEALKEQFKEARKAAKKGNKSRAPSPPPPNSKKAESDFIKPKQKGKRGAAKADKPVVTPEDIARVVEEINTLRSKMVDKWGEAWIALISRLRTVYSADSDSINPSVLCLGVGKPFTDRTAKIQLAFILELAASLGATAPVETFDPVYEDADRQVVEALSCTITPENLKGEHVLADQPHLIYMPHCSKALYESFFTKNFTSRLGESPPCVLLGNDLAEYLPGFIREDPNAEKPAEDEFVKPKKKRKGRGPAERQVQDSVLRRLVPHFEVLPMTELPETNLPGFARAFLSLAFQWLPAEKVTAVDWETPLPPVEWPEDGEVL